MLTQAELKSILHYNPETGIFTWLKNHAHIPAIGKIAGHLNKRGYIAIKVQPNLYSGHRLAWLYMTGSWPKKLLDHINGIKNDNRWCNLREVTQSQNKQNMYRKPANAKKGLLGVCFKNNGWEASIKVDYKSIYIGRFKTEIEAHNAYLEMKRKIHPFSNI
jgi:hypothetical protein